MIGQTTPFVLPLGEPVPVPTPSLHHPATQVIIRHHPMADLREPFFLAIVIETLSRFTAMQL